MQTMQLAKPSGNGGRIAAWIQARSNIHTAALRDGMTYVMVGFDNEAQRPRLTWHQLDDGREGIVAPCHDPILRVCKWRRATGGKRN